MRAGFRTAEQLVRTADIDERTRQALLTEPRRDSAAIQINGEEVTLRDQGPLFARSNLASILGDGLTVADWIALLNRRVYLFSNATAKDKLLSKYVERDGAQDVLTISPMRLFDTASRSLELTAQNTGAIARRSGPQKHTDTFQPVRRFPDRQPAEVTIVDGLADTSVIVHAERHYRDGTKERLTS